MRKLLPRSKAGALTEKSWIGYRPSSGYVTRDDSRNHGAGYPLPPLPRSQPKDRPFCAESDPRVTYQAD